jgi:hypothetical protein
MLAKYHLLVRLTPVKCKQVCVHETELHYLKMLTRELFYLHRLIVSKPLALKQFSRFCHDKCSVKQALQLSPERPSPVTVQVHASVHALYAELSLA